VDFSVASILPNTSGKPMVLFLAYSNTKETTPQIPTKNTSYPFLLGGGLQILAAYNLDPMTVQPQATTTIGQALGEPAAKLTFSISLDMQKVNALMTGDAGKLYFQAGLMTQEDLAAGNLSNVILSEVDTIQFMSSCTGTTVAKASTSGKTVNSGTTAVNTSNGSKTSGTCSAPSTTLGSKTSSSTATCTPTPPSTGTSKSGTQGTTTPALGTKS
jgi:hypothetical protein